MLYIFKSIITYKTIGSHTPVYILIFLGYNRDMKRGTQIKEWKPLHELTPTSRRLRLTSLIARLGPKKVEILNRIVAGEHGPTVYKEVMGTVTGTKVTNLLKSDTAIGYLEIIMDEAIKKNELTVTEVIDKFRETYDMAKDEKEFKPMIDATRGLGDILGAFKAVDNTNNIAVQEALRVSDSDKEEAKRLAKILGYELLDNTSEGPIITVVDQTSLNKDDLYHQSDNK